MPARVLKLSFRRKQGSPSTVKVYLTFRPWQERGPRQLHLGYLTAAERLSDSSKRRLRQRLRAKWQQHFGSADVTIDWVATERNWRTRDKPRRPALDRAAARTQLRLWQSGADEAFLPCFGGPHPQSSELAGGEFHERFLESHEGIVARLRHCGRSVDPVVVATWWEEQEAPRLLCCFYRLVRRRPALRFGRAGFLRYLAGNIARGFAAAQFLREHACPLLSPLTDSASLGEGAPENDGA